MEDKDYGMEWGPEGKRKRVGGLTKEEAQHDLQTMKAMGAIKPRILTPRKVKTDNAHE